MAQILEFTIENLAGRSAPISFKLNPDVNVFFGLNGSGKTTLLKILHSALSTETDILEDLPFSKASVKVYLNRHRKSFVRTFVQPEKTRTAEVYSTVGPLQTNLWQNLGTEPTLAAGNWLFDTPRKVIVAASWSSEPAEPDEKLTTHKTGFLPISRLYRNVKTASGANRLSDQELDSAFARGLQTQWSEYYADISQAITKAQERGLANILGFFLAGGQDQGDQTAPPSDEEAYKRIAGFLERQPGFGHLLGNEKEFKALYARKPELRNVVKQIETIENDIDVINAPRERFRNVLESMFTGSKHLVFTEKEIKIELQKKEIGLSLLSSGEKQLLFIALHALVGRNHSLIVDEPELSMHVDWQKKLISILRDLNPQIQLIMATHSPEIMADIPDSQTFAL